MMLRPSTIVSGGASKRSEVRALAAVGASGSVAAGSDDRCWLAGAEKAPGGGEEDCGVRIVECGLAEGGVAQESSSDQGGWGWVGS